MFNKSYTHQSSITGFFVFLYFDTSFELAIVLACYLGQYKKSITEYDRIKHTVCSDVVCYCYIRKLLKTYLLIRK